VNFSCHSDNISYLKKCIGSLVLTKQYLDTKKYKILHTPYMIFQDPDIEEVESI